MQTIPGSSGATIRKDHDFSASVFMDEFVQDYRHQRCQAIDRVPFSPKLSGLRVIVKQITAARNSRKPAR